MQDFTHQVSECMASLEALFKVYCYSDIKPEHEAILVEYERLGIVKIKRPKRTLVKDIYQPSLYSDTFEDISAECYIAMLNYWHKQFKTGKHMSQSLFSSYKAQYWQYFREYDRKPLVIGNKDAGHNRAFQMAALAEWIKQREEAAS